MKIVRIVAEDRSRPRGQSRRVFKLIAGVNADDRVVPGEWFGCVMVDNELWGFGTVDFDKLWGWLQYDDRRERINLPAKVLRPGETFTIQDEEDEDEEWLLQITSVHVLCSDLPPQPA